jgi:hypothetical protein
MKKSVSLAFLCLAGAAPFAVADQAPTPPSPQAVSEARAACETDIQTLCPSVQPGGGRIIACLKEHKEKVSDGCKKAIMKATQNPS